MMDRARCFRVDLLRERKPADHEPQEALTHRLGAAEERTELNCSPARTKQGKAPTLQRINIQEGLR